MENREIDGKRFTAKKGGPHPVSKELLTVKNEELDLVLSLMICIPNK